MATTVHDLITMALTDAGVLGQGQTATAEDANKALTRYNFLLGEWQRKRWLLSTLTTVGFTSTGAVTYTVGPAGNFATAARPDKIEGGFLRQLTQPVPNQVDYPLTVIAARQDYNTIALKQLKSFPSYLYYEPTFPLGTLYPWPVPPASIYAIYLSFKSILSQFTAMNQIIDLPLEYFNALHLEGARRLRIAYRLAADPSIDGAARDAMNTLRNANSQIAVLQMPHEVMRPGIYDPYSDRMY